MWKGSVEDACSVQGVLVSVAVGRWQVAWSWELVAGRGRRMAWSRDLLVFVAISGLEVPMT